MDMHVLLENQKGILHPAFQLRSLFPALDDLTSQFLGDLLRLFLENGWTLLVNLLALLSEPIFTPSSLLK